MVDLRSRKNDAQVTSGTNATGEACIGPTPMTDLEQTLQLFRKEVKTKNEAQHYHTSKSKWINLCNMFMKSLTQNPIDSTLPHATT